MVRVLGDGIRSDPINVCTGVRHGCVIAPVIFNLYLAAVRIAAAQGISPEDGVLLSYRLDGNLFNLRRLKAPTKTTRDCVVELQYADEAAIVGCTSDGLQRNLQELEQTYTRAGLLISTDKTEAMTTLQPNIEPATFKVYNTSIKNVNSFKYLGSIINIKGNMTDEIHRRISLASTSFGKLSGSVSL
ncbi:uncharacterized protein LOC143034765 [Oratosquilla oratoria]|uniref:uncharacterized protein LOC143034765 n=1 Tax=Oratosquilla oratoria TaxID=337810 RepID=UPI003F7716F0